MRPVSIAVLTEDSAKDAHAVVQCLLRAMLKLIDEQLPLYDQNRIKLQPSEDPEKKAMRGNLWQAHRSREARILLQRYMERQLKRTDVEGFVIVHVDGDRPYEQSKAGTESHNQARFERDIVSTLRVSLQDRPELLERVVLMVPFYSIEAWLYQNTQEALRLYEQHYCTHTTHIAQLQDWQSDPSALDEVAKPKEKVSIGARFNRELASQRFPAQRVYAVGKSFHKSVERLRACAPLLAALLATRSP
jgi:hypothetical protein